MALHTPQIIYQNILNQPSSPPKNTQNSVKSILQNKIQVSNTSTKKLVLPPELETLKNVILLQHIALAPHIQELGNNYFKITESQEVYKLNVNCPHHQTMKITQTS
jgi:hypothetical protein